MLVTQVRNRVYIPPTQVSLLLTPQGIKPTRAEPARRRVFSPLRRPPVRVRAAGMERRGHPPQPDRPPYPRGVRGPGQGRKHRPPPDPPHTPATGEGPWPATIEHPAPPAPQREPDLFESVGRIDIGASIHLFYQFSTSMGQRGHYFNLASGSGFFIFLFLLLLRIEYEHWERTLLFDI